MPARPCPIAFCITELDPGGAERALVQIVTRLDRLQWESRVYCLAGPGELVAQLEAADVPVQCLGANSRWDVGVIRRLRQELQAFRPQVLQTFLFHANMAGRWAARRAGVPIVVSGVRVAERDARWRMRLDRWTNRLVTHNVCVSESVANVYRSLGIAADKVSVVPNGVDAARFATATPASREELGIPPSARVLLAVGRLHPQKGFDALLEAAEPILKSDADLHLVIAGEGPQRPDLERKIAASAQAARMHLIGRRHDIPGLMRACDLFVLSSRWEGMPNVVLEAMAAGLPVVATDVEGVREIIDDGVSGVIVASESAVSLSTGISRVLADERFAKALGGAAQERVRAEFTWEEAARRYCELWQRLVGDEPWNLVRASRE